MILRDLIYVQPAERRQVPDRTLWSAAVDASSAGVHYKTDVSFCSASPSHHEGHQILQVLRSQPFSTRRREAVLELPQCGRLVPPVFAIQNLQTPAIWIDGGEKHDKRSAKNANNHLQQNGKAESELIFCRTGS